MSGTECCVEVINGKNEQYVPKEAVRAKKVSKGHTLWLSKQSSLLFSLPSVMLLVHSSYKPLYIL